MKSIVCKDTSKFKSKYLNSGKNADCYLTEDKKVYKEFGKMTEEIHDNIVRLNDLEIDSFIFPETLVYGDKPSYETIKGYIMRYSKGIDFNNISYYTQMRDFLKALSKFEKDIIGLSKEKFEIYDLKGANVLYTKDDKIEVIDTDFYKYYPSLLEEDLRVCNFMELEYLLYTSFIREKQKKLKNSRLLEMYERFSDGKELATDYLSELIAEMEKETHESVDTYGDFKAGMKHILRA